MDGAAGFQGFQLQDSNSGMFAPPPPPPSAAALPPNPTAAVPSNAANKPAPNNNNKPPAAAPCAIREQDRFMPIANVIRIMRKVLPAHAKISDDAKETIQECVSEYISFITSEANERCQREQRKTITAEDVLWSMSKLGFDDYVEPLSLYLHKYRELEGDHRGSIRGDPLPSLKRTASMANLPPLQPAPVPLPPMHDGTGYGMHMPPPPPPPGFQMGPAGYNGNNGGEMMGSGYYYGMYNNNGGGGEGSSSGSGQFQMPPFDPYNNGGYK